MKHIWGKFLMICMTLSLLFGGCTALKVEAAEAAELNFLVVESSYLEAPGEQNVAVSVGDGETEITEAVLYYTNRETGETYEKQADRIEDDAMLFTMQFEQEEQSGIYELTGMEYTASGETREVDLRSLEKEVIFGVSREVEEASENTMEAQVDVQEEIAVVDEQGKTVSDVSIAEALEKASDSAAGQARLYKAGSGKFVVALDPGHGGSDPGVQRIFGGVTYSERDLVLKIANFCKEELEKNGIEVVLTRTDNHSTLMNRKERTDYAVERGASIIVSIHLNSTEATNGTATGSLVVVPNKNTDSGELSNQLAAEILSKLELLGLKNRGTTVDEELGMILYPKQYGIPGIIVEHAFLNNANDVTNYLNSDAKLKKLGIADAQGIMEYMKNHSIAFGNSSAIYNGLDYSAVFDAEYYANKYPDLKRTYGNDEQKLLKHFAEWGVKEGRQGNPEFNVDVYRSNYGDLQNAFGSNLDKYYWHYIVAGKSEKRNAKTSISGKLTFYQGVNYASVYDTDYYYKNHPDLQRVYGKDPVALLEHFVTWGSKMEGRQGNAEFNPAIYKENYKDLRAAYGNDWKKYYDHYRTWGKSHEARIADKRIVPVMYNGLEYAAVFDADYYYDHNPDLQRAYGHDEKALFKHFAEWGSKVEGRQGNTEFNMNVYKAKNKDLQNAYGDQKEKYYWHYIVAGRREGRIAQ